MENSFVISYRELRVYQTAFDSAMQVFEQSREFPVEEQHQLTTFMVRAARLVCAHIAQAWQKRRNQDAFVARLNQAVLSTSLKGRIIVLIPLHSRLFAHVLSSPIPRRNHQLLRLALLPLPLERPGH